MTTDPYTDAIQAGAAALAKPYRDPDTVSAFVEAFPTIAAARVIEAALPHLRASILAEQAAPGPCSATTHLNRMPVEIDCEMFDPGPLVALCDLRAGHAGQHEAIDSTWGNCRWSDTAPIDFTEQWPELVNRCASPKPGAPGVVCWKFPGHADAHDNGAYMWNDCGEDVPREE